MAACISWKKYKDITFRWQIKGSRALKIFTLLNLSFLELVSLEFFRDYLLVMFHGVIVKIVSYMLVRCVDTSINIGS